MDRLTKSQRSKNMRAVKNKGSKIEQILAEELSKEGITHRKNDPQITGKPDMVILSQRIAIFCDSEFWHGKNWKKKKHEIKTNRDFWHPKIERNIARDKEVNRILRKAGWMVLRFWGKDILNKTANCVKIIEKAIDKQKHEEKNKRKTTIRRM